MNRITRQKGSNGPAVEFTIQRRSADGGYEADAGTWTNDDALICTVWPGGDRARVTILPTSWVSASDGIVQVTFPSTSWTGVEPGLYQAAVQTNTVVPTNLVLFEIALEAGPANGVERPTYIERADLESEYPGILGLIGDDVEHVNNLCADARNWIDNLILSHYRRPTCAADVGPYQFYVPWMMGPETNEWLADALENNGLLQFTPNGRRLRKAQAYWVLAKIFRRMAISAPTLAANYLDQADYHARQANDTLMTSSAELDLVGDGRVSLVVSLRSTVTRRR